MRPNRTSAKMVGTAVNVAQALRPARIMMPGTKAPRNGRLAIRGNKVLPSLISVPFCLSPRAVKPDILGAKQAFSCGLQLFKALQATRNCLCDAFCRV